MDILGIGECMIELDAESDLASSTVFQRQVGGDVFNTLAAAASLGSQMAFLSRVALDGFGQVILAACDTLGIETTWVETTLNGHNGLYFTAMNPDGKHTFLYYRKGSAASQLQPAQFTPELAKQATIIYATGITQAISPTARQTVLKAFRQGKAQGATIAFDPNYRPNLWPHPDEAFKAFMEILPYVDVLLPSQDDVEGLLGLDTQEEVISYFHEKGVPLLALKQGDQGVLLSLNTADEPIQHAIPAHPPQKIIDTIGAGDAFNGGFLHGLLQQKSLTECANIGVKMASASLSEVGPIKGFQNN